MDKKIQILNVWLNIPYRFILPLVLYMSFDKFLLAVESRYLSQAYKSIILVSSFPCWVMGSRTLNYTKKTIWHLAIWQNWYFSSKIFNIEKFTFFSVCLVRGKSEKIKNIYFAENSGLTEKEVLLPFTQVWKEDTIIILLSAWDRSCDSKAKRNLSKHM